jgi:hypothetical protein
MKGNRKSLWHNLPSHKQNKCLVFIYAIYIKNQPSPEQNNVVKAFHSSTFEYVPKVIN